MAEMRRIQTVKNLINAEIKVLQLRKKYLKSLPHDTAHVELDISTISRADKTLHLALIEIEYLETLLSRTAEALTKGLRL